jgi:hypothetical protein
VLVGFAAALLGGAAAAIGITQQRDALKNTFDALGGGAGAGEKTLAMLDKLSSKLPYTTDQLAKWGKSLMAAGLQGPALEKAITAVASATAIMGDAGGAAADKLIKKLAEAAATGGRVKLDKGMLKQLATAGVSAEALAKELGTTPDKLASMNLSAKQLGDAMQNALIKQGKGSLEAMSLTWESIWGKLKDGISSLFEGLGPDVQAFMGEVKSLFAEFSRGSTTMGGLKAVVTAVFHTLFAVAKTVVNAIHIGFLKLEIAFLKVKIALQPLINGIAKLIPKGAAITVLTYIVKGLAVVFAVLAAVVFVCALPFILLVAAIIGVVVAVGLIVAAIGEAIAWMANLAVAAASAGADFIAGLVNAISGGAAAVVSAAIGVAKGAVDAVKKALGIASPSKVMMQIGTHTTDGLANSIEDGAADVHAAARGAGGAAIAGAKDGIAGASGRAGANGASGAGGVQITVEAGAIVINGSGGDVMSLTEEALALLLERLAIQRGLVAA